jgi:adenylate cyclase
MNKFGKKSNYIWAIIIGVVASLFVLLFSEFHLFKTWELKTYDLRMQLTRAGRTMPDDVALFYVDEPSLRYMEKQGLSWPWPRELYASAISFARRGGAKAIVFDLFFSEDSVYGVEDDEAFARGISGNPPVYFVLFSSNNDGQVDQRKELVIQKSGVPFNLSDQGWLDIKKSLSSLPISGLVSVAKGFGNAQIPPDKDGVYRRVVLIEKMDGVPVPAIALKVVSDLLNVKEIKWPEEDELIIDGKTVPLDEDGKLMVNYYGGVDTFPVYSLAEVLLSEAQVSEGGKSQLDPTVVKDKVVIIGVAAPGLYDTKATPFSRVSPGPEVHATVIENLIDFDFITPIDRLPAILLTIACGLLVAIGVAAIASTWGIVVWFVLLLLALVGSSFYLFSDGTWVPLVPPFGALVVSAFAMIFFRFMTEGRKKREIKRAFGQYLSPEVVKEIAQDPKALKLGGVEREITIFFSDIADFTSISEKRVPRELVEKLNEYFSMSTRIIHENGGTLDKYIGDAVMAFWGAPLIVHDHAFRAVKAALEIQDELKKGSEFATRIGIHTSAAVVGNIGSDIRFNYTAIGDAVNLASRIEGLNKKYGTRNIISEATFIQSGGIEARRIGRVRVKGRVDPIGIFEPLGLKGDFGYFDNESCKKFEEALVLFEEAKFEEAGAIFTRLSEDLSDPVSGVYKKFCSEYKESSPENFDGVITFTTK